MDSISYAQGINFTQGLDQYLLQMGVDSTQLNDFVKGFLEGANVKEGNKAETARIKGLHIGQEVAVQMLPGVTQQIFGTDTTKKINKNDFLAGFIAATLNKNLKISKADAEIYAQTAIERIKAEANKVYLEENAKFLEENATKEGVVALPSGLQYKVITEGKGAKPTAESTVKVIYKGTLINGTEFDSTEKQGGEPATFSLNGVISGWTEGIQLMPVGSKYILYVPYNMGYGESGYPQAGIGPYAALIFEVELLDIVAAQ
ncbi:peptidyl-prolyl cis-trans isomerase [Bacteroidia bacterium]|nr:peptidyl-prolyl cis-trans isomerase [Bacteroidia bacterium]